MNFSNCPRCGRVYMKNVKNLCPDCIRDDDQMYDKVYRFLRDNPRSTVTQVAEATEVPEDRVLQFLRDGRIQASQWQRLEYPCERCGSTITNGRYCEKCSRESQLSLQSLSNQLKATAAHEANLRDKQGYHIEERAKKRD